MVLVKKLPSKKKDRISFTKKETSTTSFKAQIDAANELLSKVVFMNPVRR